MLLNRILAASIAAVFAMSAHSAEVGSGTLTLSETTITFGGGPIVGTNAGSDAGLQCIDPLFPCDTFALSSELPEDLDEYFPTALIRVILAPTDSPTGADDYDLVIYDENGAELASSASAGATEAVSVIAYGGVKSYTVEVIHWLVLGGSYSATMELSLGAPSEDKTDEEVALWLSENGGSDTLYANARAATNCEEPGLLLLEDAGGDVNPLALGLIQAPIDNLDLQQLHVFQVGAIDDPENPPLIGFRLKVASLELPFLPNSAYYSSFVAGGGAIYGVRLSVDEQGTPSFFSYTPSENNGGTIDGRFVAAGSERPAHAQSYYDNQEIVIFVRPQDIGLLEPGQALSGFNAATTLMVGVPGVGGLVSGTMDEMPDGLGRAGNFIYLSDEECAMDDDASAEGRSLGSTIVRGGSLGWLSLVLIALAGIRRRV